MTGQIIRHDATGKVFLRPADAVAFIAESRLNQAGNNVESFGNLERNLAMVGLDIETIPLTIQFNKHNPPDIVAEQKVHRIWDPTHIPVCMASALNGIGVVESCRTLLDLVYTALDRRYTLAERRGLDRASFLEQSLCRDDRTSL